jgi:hypothetical protein
MNTSLSFHAPLLIRITSRTEHKVSNFLLQMITTKKKQNPTFSNELLKHKKHQKEEEEKSGTVSTEKCE